MRQKTMKTQENNYAFIDSQNLNLGIQSLGWNLKWNIKRKSTAEGQNDQRCLFLCIQLLV